MENHIWRDVQPTNRALSAGVRFGQRGTHTSRTMMLAELSELFSAVSAAATSNEYATAIIEENVLGKRTYATRHLTWQRLRELYALDPQMAIFRVLRRLWAVDEAGRPLLALLCALARDPLLRATAAMVLSLQPGEEFSRATMIECIKGATGERFNAATIDKVARNAASSWTQAGHLSGRTRKLRRLVSPTAGSLALALWRGALWDLSGDELLKTPWVGIFDRNSETLLDYVLLAKKMRLIEANVGGQVVEINPYMVDPQG